MFQIGGMLMVTRVQKWGNSQGLRFPKTVLIDAQIEIGDEVEISVEDGRIIVEPIRKVRGKYTIEELVAQLPDDYEPEEIDWGDAVGNEVW